MPEIQTLFDWNVILSLPQDLSDYFEFGSEKIRIRRSTWHILVKF